MRMWHLTYLIEVGAFLRNTTKGETKRWKKKQIRNCNDPTHDFSQLHIFNSIAIQLGVLKTFTAIFFLHILLCTLYMQAICQGPADQNRKHWIITCTQLICAIHARIASTYINCKCSAEQQKNYTHMYATYIWRM